MNTREEHQGCGAKERTFIVFQIEDELSVNEKIDFIDEVENGVATYLLNIFNKWENEYDGLKKEASGRVKTVSKKAWIRRNDSRGIINFKYDVGTYWLFGSEYDDMSLICPNYKYNIDRLYTGKHIVNQWFHDLCNKLYTKESDYFKSIDPFSIKVEKIKEYAELFGCMNNRIIENIYFNGIADVAEEALDAILDGYSNLEFHYNRISKEVNKSLSSLGYNNCESKRNI